MPVGVRSLSSGEWFLHPGRDDVDESEDERVVLAGEVVAHSAQRHVRDTSEIPGRRGREALLDDQFARGAQQSITVGQHVSLYARTVRAYSTRMLTRIGSQRLAWVVLAALNLGPGLVAFAAPGGFITHVASFGAGGGHYVRDLGAAQIALGLAAAAAAVKQGWRPTAAFTLTVHFVLHAASHAIDRSTGTVAATWGVVLSLVVQAAALLTWWCSEARP